MKQFRPSTAGGTVFYWAEQASLEAKKDDVAVEFIFNEISIIVHPNSYAGDIAEIYHLTQKLLQLRAGAFR